MEEIIRAQINKIMEDMENEELIDQAVLVDISQKMNNLYAQAVTAVKKRNDPPTGYAGLQAWADMASTARELAGLQMSELDCQNLKLLAMMAWVVQAGPVDPQGPRN